MIGIAGRDEGDQSGPVLRFQIGKASGDTGGDASSAVHGVDFRGADFRASVARATFSKSLSPRPLILRTMM